MTSKKGKISTPSLPILFWILILPVCTFLLIAPFKVALFIGYSPNFVGPLYGAMIWTGLFAIILVFFIYSYKEDYSNKESYLPLLIWLLPLTYLISIIQAASYYLALQMFFIFIMYAFFFMFGYYLTRHPIGSLIIQNNIVLTGYAIVGFGFLNLFGNLHYQDAVMLPGEGLRLTSVFQYANAYAAFLLVLLFCGLHYILTNNNKLILFLHSFMLIPVTLSFILTLSRGGLLVLPIILLILLPFYSWLKQIFAMAYLSLTFLISILISNHFSNIGREIFKHFTGESSTLSLWEQPSLNGWMVLIAISLTSAMLFYFMQTFLFPYIEKLVAARSKPKKFSNFILPLSVILISMICVFLIKHSQITSWLPSDLGNRLSNINFKQNSVLERVTFFKDSLKLVSDYPLLGAGGGSWATLYGMYQNNPYLSNQAHNFFLQTLTEVGILGFTILVGFLFLCYYYFIRFYLRSDFKEKNSRMIFFIVATSILVHSFLDFEMSYGYLAILVFLSLGGMLYTNKSGNTLKKNAPAIKLRIIYPGIILLMSIFFLYTSQAKLSAHGLYNKSIHEVQTQKSIDVIFKPLDKAISLDPSNSYYKFLKIDLLKKLLQQTPNAKYENQLSTLLDNLNKKEPYNKKVLELNYQQASIEGDLEQSLAVLSDELNKFPWDLSVYERLISLHTQLGEKSGKNNEIGKENLHFNNALALHDTVVKKHAYLDTLPEGQLPGTPFYLTPSMNLNVGQIHFFRKNYANASQILMKEFKPSLESKLDRVIARWYLAALLKQNLNDQQLYDKLLSLDPNEKSEINFLLQNY